MQMRFQSVSFILLIILAGGNLCSCNPDVRGCTDPKSLNFDPDANVDDASCEYERDLLLGNWTARDTCLIGGTTEADEYLIILEAHPDSSDEVIMLNLNNCGSELTCKVNSGNIYIEFEADVCQGKDFWGSGTFTDHQIQLNYIADAGLNAEECFMKATR